MNTEEIKHLRDLVLADMLNGNDKTINGSILRKLDEQLKNLPIHVVSGSADRYTKKLDKDWDDDIYTIEEWDKAVDDGWITNDDGSGYWVKNGLKSRDEVFSTPQLDATHVVWYNK